MNRIASVPAAGLLGVLALLGFAAAPLPVAAQTGSAKPAAPMSTPRRGHTATLLTSGQVWIAGGIVNSGLTTTAATQRYDVVSNSWQSAGALHTARALHTGTLLPSGKVLVAGGLTPLTAGTTLTEIGDPSTGLWTPASPMIVARYSQVAIRLGSGHVLMIGGTGGGAPLASIERFNPATGLWTLAGNLRTARTDHTATLLADGRVLITGGTANGTSMLATAELYDPATTLSTPTGSMRIARSRHSATLLKSGQVLISQGVDGSDTLSAAEIYDPSNGTFTPANASMAPRHDGSATLMPSGDLLATGGILSFGGNTPIADAEIYRVNTAAWGYVPALTAARDNHPATLLPNGEVLLTGGVNAAPLSSAELVKERWDGPYFYSYVRPAIRAYLTASLLPDGRVVEVGGRDADGALSARVERYDGGSTWSEAAPLPVPRAEHTAVVLADGKVFVAGGTVPGETAAASTLLYDGAGDSWRPRAAMQAARRAHRAVLLDSGKVLVAGGIGAAGDALASVEIYDPRLDEWTPAAPLPVPLSGHSMTLLGSGRVLVFGGDSPGNGVQRRPQIYDPAANAWSRGGEANYPDGLADHAATLLADGSVLISGGAPPGLPVLATTRLYFPAGDTWQDGPDLRDARASHSATLLPTGKVLIAGGRNAGNGFTPLERYDATGRLVESLPILLNPGFRQHAAVLMLDGGVLLTGALERLTKAVRYDAYGYGVFTPTAVTAVTPHLRDGVALDLAGTGFAPALDAGLGRNRNSPSNVPVLQVMRVDNGLTRYLPVDPGVGFSDAAYRTTAAALDGFAAGPLRARVFVNGRAGTAAWTTRATVPGRPESPSVSGGGASGSVTVAFAEPGYSGGAPITSYALELVESGTVASCAAPCGQITAGGLNPGVHTAYLYASNAVGLGPAAAAGSIVVQAQPTIALHSLFNPTSAGSPVMLVAQLASTLPLGGTVDFRADGEPLCSAAPIINAAAGCTTTALPVGTHALTAHYAGDGLNLSAVSAELVQTVQRRATATNLTSPCTGRVVEGQPYAVAAEVMSQDGGGNVAFSIDGAVVCSVAVDAAGQASCSLGGLEAPTPGPRLVAIRAAFSGDAASAPSESAPLFVTVLDSEDLIFRSGQEAAVAGCPLP